MRDEDMAGEQFWLYRVALRPDITIEPGYRNETIDDAAQVTQAELGGSDAIRYLNTWESPGSISLAVRARALEAVQGIPCPLKGSEQASGPRSCTRSPGSGAASVRSVRLGVTSRTGWRG
jgi:hypothetical protein